MVDEPPFNLTDPSAFPTPGRGSIWMDEFRYLPSPSIVHCSKSVAGKPRSYPRSLLGFFFPSFFLYKYSLSNDERPLKGLERFDGETSCRMERLD